MPTAARPAAPAMAAAASAGFAPGGGGGATAVRQRRAAPGGRRPETRVRAAGEGAEGLWARTLEGAGMRPDVRLEDFLGDRSERLDKPPPVGPVTWPSEKVTELWKVFFKGDSKYTDVLGVAWPMRTDGLAETTPEERADMRRIAARDLVNIDNEERKRRVIFGSGLLTITLLVMWTAAKLHASPLERIHTLLPFFIGAAEIASGAGVWDVDGTGMQLVDDPATDLGIRKKIIGFVSAGAVATLFVMVPYLLWPF